MIRVFVASNKHPFRVIELCTGMHVSTVFRDQKFGR